MAGNLPVLSRSITKWEKQHLNSSALALSMSTYPPPRFFVVGDEVVIGANVHNNSENDMTVEVNLESSGLTLQDTANQTIEVPANQQAYLYWIGTVDQSAERVDLTGYANSGDEQDASKPALGTLSDQGIPVYRYTVQETVGTSGLVESSNSITEGIYLPQSIDYTQAQLSVDASPSLAASMTEGLTYLMDYPYLCMEQTVSRFLPNVIISRALNQRGLPNLTNQERLDSQVNAALQRIYAKQHSDGGWSWWDSGKSDPYLTAYVVFGLYEAQDQYSIDQKVINRGISYLTKNFPILSETVTSSELNRYAFMLYVNEYVGEGSSSRINKPL